MLTPKKKKKHNGPYSFRGGNRDAWNCGCFCIFKVLNDRVVELLIGQKLGVFGWWKWVFVINLQIVTC